MRKVALVPLAAVLVVAAHAACGSEVKQNASSSDASTTQASHTASSSAIASSSGHGGAGGHGGASASTGSSVGGAGGAPPDCASYCAWAQCGGGAVGCVQACEADLASKAFCSKEAAALVSCVNAHAKELAGCNASQVCDAPAVAYDKCRFNVQSTDATVSAQSASATGNTCTEGCLLGELNECTCTEKCGGTPRVSTCFAIVGGATYCSCKSDKTLVAGCVAADNLGCGNLAPCCASVLP